MNAIDSSAEETPSPSEECSVPRRQRHAPGGYENRQRDDLPAACPWGGPSQGDDNDVGFLTRNDDRHPTPVESPLPGVSPITPPAHTPTSPITHLSECDTEPAQASDTPKDEDGVKVKEEERIFTKEDYDEDESGESEEFVVKSEESDVDVKMKRVYAGYEESNGNDDSSEEDITGDENPEKDQAAEERRQEERLKKRAEDAERAAAERHRHQREVTEAIAREERDESFTWQSHEINLSDEQLNQLIKRKRSGKTTIQYKCVPWGIDEHVVHVKLFTKDTDVKVTQWNEWCVRSTWIH